MNRYIFCVVMIFTLLIACSDNKMNSNNPVSSNTKLEKEDSGKILITLKATDVHNVERYEYKPGEEIQIILTLQNNTTDSILYHYFSKPLNICVNIYNYDSTSNIDIDLIDSIPPDSYKQDYLLPGKILECIEKISLTEGDYQVKPSPNFHPDARYLNIIESNNEENRLIISIKP